jgi:hypothetical protein
MNENVLKTLTLMKIHLQKNSLNLYWMVLVLAVLVQSSDNLQDSMTDSLKLKQLNHQNLEPLTPALVR